MRDPRRAVGRSAVRRYVVSAGLSPVFDADERFVIDAVVAVAAAVDAGSYVCSGCDGVDSINNSDAGFVVLRPRGAVAKRVH